MTILQQIGIDQRGIAEIFGGAGVLWLAFVRHMPAPYEGQVWYGCIFDTIQDRFGNNDRIGLRRKRVPVAAPPAASIPNDPSKGPTK